jgi:methylated-DNA-[protein]-cysteine S-methyltransferase
MKAKASRRTKSSAIQPTAPAPEYCFIPSPVGELLLVADADALLGLYFAGCDHVPAAAQAWRLNSEHAVLRLAEQQLRDYFAGARKTFSVPFRLVGTEFQQRVWQQIARIPFGATVSYSELAQRAGRPEAIRAAGTSTGRNPLSIIVPCHRVVGKNGGLHGFAGGLERKRQLLGLENLELFKR